MFVVDPTDPNLTAKQRQLLRLRDRAVAIAETYGRSDPAIPASPHHFFKGHGVEILYVPSPERAPSETTLTIRNRSPTYQLDIWAAEIRGPGPALTKVAAMTKITNPIFVISGLPRKVFNIHWRSATSAIMAVSFTRGPWEDYLLGEDPKRMRIGVSS